LIHSRPDRSGRIEGTRRRIGPRVDPEIAMRDRLGFVSRMILLASYRFLRFLRQAYVYSLNARWMHENSRMGMIMETDNSHMEGW